MMKTDQPLTKLADAAFRQAAEKIVKRAQESGTPVIVFENEEIKRVDARKTGITRKKRNGRAARE